ncbi:VOC family protein [Microbacterium amylolyticum]|uniref:Catechol 2,3-dioxygenase-like lactoylglutathione lyase family enzyme n=1 Tax=Microbacterium amylolyticum TaxID=936337 RepID=A0ABS4ZEA7_9MICO|nr:VOC family protein [Microbacterium amylolyticum]MBP2435610.1 catechol 2,3-dioxygenase-like lactoylglutathione lyase family enzyme [Microbacterium amylolyticum]
MHVTSFYPVLMSDDVAATSAYYQRVLGFETTFSSDWYVSLRLGAAELAILDRSHATAPQGFGASPAGVIINVEVTDADTVIAELPNDVRFVLPLRDEPFGQRHAIIEGPEGVLIDIIQPIEPSPEFAAAYADGAESR